VLGVSWNFWCPRCQERSPTGVSTWPRCNSLIRCFLPYDIESSDLTGVRKGHDYGKSAAEFAESGEEKTATGLCVVLPNAERKPWIGWLLSCMTSNQISWQSLALSPIQSVTIETAFRRDDSVAPVIHRTSVSDGPFPRKLSLTASCLPLPYSAEPISTSPGRIPDHNDSSCLPKRVKPVWRRGIGVSLPAPVAKPSRFSRPRYTHHRQHNKTTKAIQTADLWFRFLCHEKIQSPFLTNYLTKLV
jgi:hypothetical protein